MCRTAYLHHKTQAAPIPLLQYMCTIQVGLSINVDGTTATERQQFVHRPENEAWFQRRFAPVEAQHRHVYNVCDVQSKFPVWLKARLSE